MLILMLIQITTTTTITQGRDSRKNMTGDSNSSRLSFLEAVYGFRVSFVSLCIFLGYDFDVMAVSGTVNLCFILK